MLFTRELMQCCTRQHAGSAAGREENLPYPVSMGGNGRFIQRRAGGVLGKGTICFRNTGEMGINVIRMM